MVKIGNCFGVREVERVQKDKTELKEDARNESRMERERLDTGRMWGGGGVMGK